MSNTPKTAPDTGTETPTETPTESGEAAPETGAAPNPLDDEVTGQDEWGDVDPFDDSTDDLGGVITDPDILEGLKLSDEENSVDPTEGMERVEPKPEDLEDLEWAKLQKDEDPDAPANKGVPALHELERAGLIDNNVKAHIKEFRRGYTQAKQEAAQLRKELDAVKAAANREPEPMDLPSVGLSPEYVKMVRELASQEVDPKTTFTEEGMANFAKVQAAKMMLPQIEAAEKAAQAHEQKRTEQQARARVQEFLDAHPWVLDPAIKTRVSRFMRDEGMDLRGAAFRAKYEHDQAEAAKAKTKDPRTEALGRMGTEQARGAAAAPRGRAFLTPQEIARMALEEAKRENN